MRKLLVISVIVWIGLIGWFSNQPLKESTEQTYMLLTKLNLAEQQDLILAQSEDIQFLKYAARKSAHFGLYFGLGTLLSLVVYACFRIRDRRFFWVVWGLGTLWGALDELHQYFVPGRSMQVKDMLLDSSGVFFAALVMTAVLSAYMRMKAMRREENRLLQLEYLFD